MCSHFFYIYFSTKKLFMLIILMLFITFQGVAAQDSKPIALSSGGNVVIDGGTEDEISIKKIMYSVSHDAKIIDHNGRKIELMYLHIPCRAAVTYEPQAGRELPIVTSIKVVEILPDLNLRRNQNSSIPE